MTQERTGAWMQTRHGKAWPSDPRPGDFMIEDIAHALANICRFGGHTRQFYSVAQHSILVSRDIGRTQGPVYALAGLLHDAAEAYLGDVVRPIKYEPFMEPYRELDKNTTAMIFGDYGVPLYTWGAVPVADDRVLAQEAFDLMGDPDWARGMDRTGHRITPVPPLEARVLFLEEFQRLGYMLR